MGSVDNKKMAEFQYALQSGLGVLLEGDRVSISVKEHQPVEDMSQVYTQAEGEVGESDDPSRRASLEYALQVFGPDIGVQVTYTLQGARLAFDDNLLLCNKI